MANDTGTEKVILSQQLIPKWGSHLSSSFSFSGGRIKRSIELDIFNKDADVEYITLSSDDLADLINYANVQLEKRRERKTEKSLSLGNKPQYKYTRVKRESQGIDLWINALLLLIYLFYLSKLLDRCVNSGCLVILKYVLVDLPIRYLSFFITIDMSNSVNAVVFSINNLSLKIFRQPTLSYLMSSVL